MQTKVFYTVLLVVALCWRATFAATLSEQSLLEMARVAYETDSLAAVEGLEPAALKAAGGRVIRVGSQLILHLRNNTARIYQNTPECRSVATKANCQTPHLVAFIPSVGKFLLLVSHYKSAEYLLVDETDGAESRFSAMPQFSPDRNYFLLTKLNNKNFSSMIQIWARWGREYVLDWQGKPGNEGEYTDYRLLRWAEEGEVCVKSKAQQTTDYKKAIMKTYCLRPHLPKGRLVYSPKDVATP